MKLKQLYVLLTLVSFLCGCSSAYYSTMEKVGYHKRDILVDRVETAKESQEEAQQQFTSALAEMKALINFEGGDLEDAYNTATDEYEASQAAADNVSKRINKIEDVAEALFDEWREEIQQISKASFRLNSEKTLKATERDYQQLIRSMRRAESKMAPVLTAMKDNMLYLKHNLNAQAIGALKGEFKGLKTDISNLINEMNKSIAESNKFIATLKQ